MPKHQTHFVPKGEPERLNKTMISEKAEGNLSRFGQDLYACEHSTVQVETTTRADRQSSKPEMRVPNTPGAPHGGTS